MNIYILKNNIENLRIILDEIAATASSNEELERRLAISRQMDELIVEYMKLTGTSPV